MFTIKLPDGSEKQFSEALSVYDFAVSIGPSLAKSAIAAKVDGRLVDLNYLLDADSDLFILTAKNPESLDVIRHSAAHLLAHAVKEIFPSAALAIGPVIQDGFYYDFAFDRPFTQEDLVLIEEKMHQLAKENHRIARRELNRAAAIDHFAAQSENYKLMIINDLISDEPISLYRQSTFEDLCRGPHVPSTGFLKAFKLTRVAGAYWRGDSANPMLQRIYGTAWADQAALDAYLQRIEEAEKRDHRKLGKTLDLFHFQDIAPGMVFWHPNGFIIYELLQQYMRSRLADFGYLEIRTPQLVDKELWQRSGHWDNFRDEMFVTETDSRVYVVKPMNCPCHVQIYNQGIKSYRDLPLRYSEFGNCHRCESSGSLHGLMRVRNMVQDDAHIFCTHDQIQKEVLAMLQLVRSVYADFGFNEIKYRLALRPDKRVGADALWDKAEAALKDAMRDFDIEWVDALGEGAFYGPKIECSLSDCLGRIWQCGTIQVDFSMPERLDAFYVAEDGSKQTPVMIHRAILGSFERFIGIIIEHFAGKFPLWLSPVQIVVLPISEKHHDYARIMVENLKKSGLRATFDLRSEKIGFKIREHSMQKIPYLAIVGDKEIAESNLSLRSLEGQDLGSIKLDALIDILHDEINHKVLPGPISMNRLEE